jgi:PAS domain S-box-containing protein
MTESGASTRSAPTWGKSRLYDHRDVEIAARTSTRDLHSVVSRSPIAIVVWDPETQRIVLANNAAADITGLSVPELVGMSVFDLVEPRRKVELAGEALGEGAVDAYRAQRVLRGHEDEVLYVWARAIEVDGQRFGIGIVALSRDLVGFGARTIGSPLGEVVPVAIGIIGAHWQIVTVSSDVRDVLGVEASELRGRSLLDLLAPEDARQVRDEATSPSDTAIAHFVMKNSWVDAPGTDGCLLLGAPCGPAGTRRVFAIIRRRPTTEGSRSARERELEERLRRISAEVRAAGLIDALSGAASVEAGVVGEELSARQLEVLGLLLKGDRVPTIASRLYISQSTVRNHLTHIYRRFGVHSQSGLLEKLRAGPPARG